MKADIDTSEVHYLKDGYLAKVKISGTAPFTEYRTTSSVNVTATFDVNLPKRRKREAYDPNTPLKHQKWPYEEIDQHARNVIASFCHEILKVLEPPSPR